MNNRLRNSLAGGGGGGGVTSVNGDTGPSVTLAAANIGATAPSGYSGSDVQAVLTSLGNDAIVVDSNTAITLSAATHHNKKLVCTGTNPIITVPASLPTYFHCIVVGTATAVDFTGSAVTAATLNNVDSHTSSSGAHAVCGIMVESSGVAVLFGSTAV